MKNVIIAALLLFSSFPLLGQVIEIREVPVLIVTAFANAHPKANKVQWRKLGHNYEAFYDRPKGDIVLIYDSSAKVVETQEEILLPPEPIKKYIWATYNNDKLLLKRITDSEGKVTYKGVIKSQKLLFDADGNFIKKEE